MNWPVVPVVPVPFRPEQTIHAYQRCQGVLPPSRPRCRSVQARFMVEAWELVSGERRGPFPAVLCEACAIVYASLIRHNLGADFCSVVVVKLHVVGLSSSARYGG